MSESVAKPDPEDRNLDAVAPARLPVPEAAAGSFLALVVLAVGAVASVILRRRRAADA